MYIANCNKKLIRVVFFFAAFVLFVNNGVIVTTTFASTTVNHKTLAVIVNDRDPDSVAIAEYYQKKRLIPDEHIIHVSLDNTRSTITSAEFEEVNSKVKSKFTGEIQAYVLAWSKPYRVDCMSITSAFALGFDKKYCAKGCKKTEAIGYYNSNSRAPNTDFGVKPTMMLASENRKSVFDLINRGVDADYSRPGGYAYLLSTSDKERNVRSVVYPRAIKSFEKIMDISIVKGNALSDKQDILFYFTGLKNVKNIDSNQFFPGAIADHLTSTGGVLFNGSQMSALKWIEGGATGTYGTVVEPCNYLGKFPNPAIVMKNYLNGDTLIESYWKSVSMPGQGLFVGEPLASPYKDCRIIMDGSGVYHFALRKVPNYVMRSSVSCH
jgi:uncharacterized protein (TIGR03790 family)